MVALKVIPKSFKSVGTTYIWLIILAFEHFKGREKGFAYIEHVQGLMYYSGFLFSALFMSFFTRPEVKTLLL